MNSSVYSVWAMQYALEEDKIPVQDLADTS